MWERLAAAMTAAHCRPALVAIANRGLDRCPGRGGLESKSEAFGHCKSYALRATLLHSSLTGDRNYD